MSGALSAMYRMPVSFGPSPGPRNVPEGQSGRRYEKDVTSLTMSAATDAEALARLLPNGFALRGAPRITVSVMLLRNIGWLAGRGYNIVMVMIPARWEGKEQLDGSFVPVLWESMADPILTGREELGWCKIFANIPEPLQSNGNWTGSADWEGFDFFEFATGGFEAAPEDAVAPMPMMFQKYIPRTGEWGSSDVSYPTVTGDDGVPATLISREEGHGRFAFRHARWEDMPTQYPIVSALAALPLDDFGTAVRSRASGGGDGRSQRILR